MFDYVFIPFLIRSSTCVIYFSWYLWQEAGSDQTIFQWITKVCVYITTVYFAIFELGQVVDKGALEYFSDTTNHVDVCSAVLNIVLMVEQDWYRDDWYGFKTQKILTAIALSCIWY